MVSKTFENLPAAKQQRVTAALLEEFSTHSLATAQVARIVKGAGIARGAFYQYFDDLQDSYLYLFGQAMQAVHAQLPQTRDYYAATAAFVNGATDSQYLPLMRQHFAHNQAVLPTSPDHVDATPAAWAAKVLCHETIKAALLAPDTASARLAQLQAALALLSENRK